MAGSKTIICSEIENFYATYSKRMVYEDSRIGRDGYTYFFGERKDNIFIYV